MPWLCDFIVWDDVVDRLVPLLSTSRVNRLAMYYIGRYTTPRVLRLGATFKQKTHEDQLHPLPKLLSAQSLTGRLLDLLSAYGRLVDKGRNLVDQKARHAPLAHGLLKVSLLA